MPRQVVAGLGVGLAVAALVLARALLTPDGYLSPDSMSYLALARNLDLGRGLYMQNGGYAPAGFAWFATWPAGYPLGIHIVDTLTGLAPFMGAKILSIIAVLACTGAVARAGGRHGALLALPFAFAASLEIFSYAWSEVPFVLCLVMAALLLAGIIGGPARGDALRSFGLAGCCLGLFLCRYVGAFAVSLTGIAMLIGLWRRDYRLAALNGVLLLALAGAIALYLRHNAALTGYATGMARIAPLDSAGHRFAMLASALASSAVLPAVRFVQNYRSTPYLPPHGALLAAAVVQLAAMVLCGRWIAARYPKAWREIRIDALALAFALVGGLYLGAIIVLRWTSQFDPYDFRLLGPGVLLLEVALLRAALVSWPQAVRAIGLFAAAIAALSFVWALLPLASQQAPGYSAIIADVERRYQAVPSGAIVVFGNQNLLYLRPDLFIAEPMCRPWFDEDESWDDFTGEIDTARPVYVDMTGRALHLQGCQPSVRAFLAGHRAGALFKLD